MTRWTFIAALAVTAATPALAQAPASGTAAAPAPAAGTTAAAPASAPAKVTVGAAVSDPKGGAVGTIEAVSGDLATVSTGTNKVQVPTSSFAASGTGLVIGMTKTELDAAASGAAASAKAQLSTQLAKGTKVMDSKGGEVGTIEAADAQFVTVATATSKVRLPVSAFAMGANGPVIAMTASELEAAAKGAAPSGS